VDTYQVRGGVRPAAASAATPFTAAAFRDLPLWDLAVWTVDAAAETAPSEAETAV